MPESEVAAAGGCEGEGPAACDGFELVRMRLDERAAGCLASVLAMGERGVRSSSVRLAPTVHGEGDARGFIPILIGIAREKGMSAYVGDGSNRWPAVHRLDAASLFRLAVESAPAGARLRAVAGEGIPFKEIAEAIGRQLELPAASLTTEEAGRHFGFLAPLVGPLGIRMGCNWLRAISFRDAVPEPADRVTTSLSGMPGMGFGIDEKCAAPRWGPGRPGNAATTWNSIRYTSVSSWTGPAWAVLRRRDSRSVSPAWRTPASSIDEKGTSSTDSTSIMPSPTR
jgi:hypothetical protein